MLRGSTTALRLAANSGRAQSAAAARSPSIGCVTGAIRSISSTSCLSADQHEQRTQTPSSSTVYADDTSSAPRLRSSEHSFANAQQRRSGPAGGRRSQARRNAERDRRPSPKVAAQSELVHEEVHTRLRDGVKAESVLMDFETAWKMWEKQRSEEGGLLQAPGPFLRRLVRSLQPGADTHPTMRLEVLVNDFQAVHMPQHAVPALARLAQRGEYAFVFAKVRDIVNDVNLDRREFEAWSPLLMLACVAASNLPGSPRQRIVDLVRPLTPTWHLPRTAPDNTRQIRTHFNGCPLLYEMNDYSVHFGDVPLVPTASDENAYKHATLAWGLRARSDDPKSQSKLLTQRISSAASANHHDALVELPLIVEEASDTYLSVSYEPDVEAEWNPTTWSMLLRSLLSKRKNAAASKTWDLYNRLKPKQQPIAPALWNGLLSGYGGAGDFEGAKNVFEEMKKSKSSFDAYCYTTMIGLLYRAEQPYEARLLYEELLDLATKRKDKMPVGAITAVIVGLTTTNQIEEAAKIVTEMMQQTNEVMPLPTIAVFNALIRAYARKGDLDGMTQALRAIGQLGLQPDMRTFTTYLDGFTRMGKTEHVGKIFDIMRSQGIQGDEITFSAIIKSMLDTNDGKTNAKIVPALELLLRMERYGPMPTEVTYTNVISGLFRSKQNYRQLAAQSRVHPAYGREAAFKERLDRQMAIDVLWPYRPEVVTAMVLVKNMVQKRRLPNTKTINTLFNQICRPVSGAEVQQGPQAMVKVRDVNLASMECGMKVLDRMRVDGVEWTERTLEVVTEGLMRFTMQADDEVAGAALQHLRIVKDGLPSHLTGQMERRVYELQSRRR